VPRCRRTCLPPRPRLLEYRRPRSSRSDRRSGPGTSLALRATSRSGAGGFGMRPPVPKSLVRPPRAGGCDLPRKSSARTNPAREWSSRPWPPLATSGRRLRPVDQVDLRHLMFITIGVCRGRARSCVKERIVVPIKQLPVIRASSSDDALERSSSCMESVGSFVSSILPEVGLRCRQARAGSIEASRGFSAKSSAASLESTVSQYADR
jgi:hypothetical protein